MELGLMNKFLDKSPKILVIGDLMIDQYLWGSCERISPEAPVPILNINKETSVLGGAGNVVNNLKKFGSSVDIMSVIGSGEVSDQLLSQLNRIGVETKYLIRQKTRNSSRKTRIIAPQQQIVRYDRESKSDINSTSQKKILDTLKKIITNYEGIILSDYGKGVLTTQLTKSVIQIAKKNNVKLFVDPKGINYEKYTGAYLLTPNKKEASEATSIKISNNESLLDAITNLKNLCSLEISIITLSEGGIAVYDNELRIHPTNTKEIFDVTGAGDTVIAALAFAILSNHSINDSIEFANLAAGVVIGKVGSATATINEISEYASKLNKSTSDKHIKTIKEIEILVDDLKDRNKRVVFTNGCFDLLHAGHVNYLEKAKKFGDILIIGLNSDQSIQELKGSNRPINSSSDRAYILAALEAVDYVVIFNEKTPFELIKKIKPHVLVKGGDYADKDIVGSDIVEEVKVVDFIDGKSSSNIINQILNIEE
jgi:D-beta-D-heptose 7-phosphate kinase / D-beta-D-heptose 1-phosphate adenosyltransferase